MKRLAALLVLFIMVLGGTCCIHHQNAKQPTFFLSETMKKRVWIDATFSVDEQDAIIRAFHTIECSTNYSLVQFEFVRNATIGDYYRMKLQPSIVVINSISTDPRIKASDKRLEKDHKGKQTAGLYLSQEEIPTVLLPRDRLKKSEFYQVVVHEAIHSAFNILTHSDSQNAVMYYATDETSARDLTEDDLKFICDTYQCDSELFNVCRGE